MGRWDPSALELHRGNGAGRPHDHFVELYQDDESLIGSLRTFVAMGIADGEAIVVIAERTHSDALETALSAVVDVEAARAQGLYITLDAEETLDRFMKGDSPDPVRFERVIGEAIGRAAAAGRRVRLFGEMVAVLWGRGNVEGALALEDLWNGLAEEYSFRLFCAYPSSAFGGKNSAPLNAVCERHSHVLMAVPSTN